MQTILITRIGYHHYWAYYMVIQHKSAIWSLIRKW